MSLSQLFRDGDLVRVKASPGTGDAGAWRGRTLRVVKRAVQEHLVVVDVEDPGRSGLLHDSVLEPAGEVVVDVLGKAS